MHSPSRVEHGLCEPMATSQSLRYQIIDSTSGIAGSRSFEISSLDHVVRDTLAVMITVDGEGHFSPDTPSPR
jgi:hypothetical protein